MAPFVAGNILDNDFTDIWSRKLEKCWDNIRDKKFIEGFNENDYNTKYINYWDREIYL